jgi:hypothetical protein
MRRPLLDWCSAVWSNHLCLATEGDSSGSEKYCVCTASFTREYRRLEVMWPLVGRKQLCRDRYVLLGRGARGARVSRLDCEQKKYLCMSEKTGKRSLKSG